jgi:hypothetical protein
VTVAPPAPAVPMSRRSRRAAQDTGGPTRPVLPVAPLGAAPAAWAPDDVVPAGAADVPAAPPVPAEAGGPGGPADVPAAPDPLADPLAGPVDPGSLAAEPAVLDPALDGLWPAPVPELTVEQPLPPGLAAGAAGDPADPATAPATAPDTKPVAEPLDRERAAAELDPLWARRARRPQGPRRSHDRPAALRREPAPVVLQPVPGYAASAAAEAAAPPEPVDGGEPLLVVLPEPDVPDVLMLPESDVVRDGAGDDAPAAPDDPAWPGVPGRQGTRPAPGTLSLDELLVLHTRRPGGRRAGSADRPGDEAGRRLE